MSRRRTDSASTTLLASEQSQLTSRNCGGPLVQQKSLLHPRCAVSSRFGALIFCATLCSAESAANPFGSASSRCRGSFFANLNFRTLCSPEITGRGGAVKAFFERHWVPTRCEPRSRRSVSHFSQPATVTPPGKTQGYQQSVRQEKKISYLKQPATL